MSLPAYPLWSLAILAIDIIVISQVAQYGDLGAGMDDTPDRMRAAPRGTAT
jgi:hypothetical protein